jgi:hypothetical protein
MYTVLEHLINVIFIGFNLDNVGQIRREDSFRRDGERDDDNNNNKELLKKQIGIGMNRENHSIEQKA